MIIKIVNINEANEYLKKDLFSIRIKALLNAYGTGYDFVSFYKQIDDNGKITALLSRLDGDWTLSEDSSDSREISEFLNACGYSSFLTDGNFSHSGNYDSGIIMKSNSKREYSGCDGVIDEYPKLMDLYNFQDYDKSDFEMWYVDINHRIRHGCSKAYSLNINGIIASSGIFSSVYQNDAVLSSLLTAPEYRKNGYGSALVGYMLGDIKGDAYLMREVNKNESFYKRLGFENIGYWRMYK